MPQAQIISSPILSSTLLLTILMLIGFFFFIRASVKDRTEKLTLNTPDSPELMLQQLQNYFEQRAYHLQSVNPEDKKIILEGFVQASWFLTIFLSILAGLGLFCLALVLSSLNPESGNIYYYLVLLAPGAGFFYRSQAARVERVGLQLESEHLISVIAHRDELAQLQSNLEKWEVGSGKLIVDS